MSLYELQRRWIRRYSLNRHPCTSVGQTIINTGAIQFVYLRDHGFGQAAYVYVHVGTLYTGIHGELYAQLRNNNKDRSARIETIR